MVNTDHTLVSVQAVRERLLASVNQTWQQDVEQQLSREHDLYQSYDDEYKFKLFLSYVLHTDMRHYWNVVREGEQPWFVQIEQVQDISQPVKGRLSSGSDDNKTRGSRRMLKMVLFDGKKHHVGIEHASLGFRWPRLGSKLVIDTGVSIRKGILMLTPSTCGFLGGSVKEFEEHQKHVDAVVQEPLFGRRGPPLKLEEYVKILKEKIEHIEQQPAGLEGQNRDVLEPAAAAPAAPPPEEIYIIPSESDDEWDIEALLEKKRTRIEVHVVEEEQEDQQKQQHIPPAPVRADDNLASTLREMKRRKEMREKQLNKTL